MWAIYDRAAGSVVIGKQTLIRFVEKNAKVKAVRVAIIPLFDVETIVERAANAFTTPYVNGENPDACIRAALTAAGIPCKRKARK